MPSSNDVVFLDIDGVLHHFAPDSPDFVFMDNFVNVMHKFPNADIVISSDWRKHKKFYDIVNVFPESIRHRIIGTTPILDLCDAVPVLGIRSIEADLWLSSNGRSDCNWVAIDDDTTLWRAGANLVGCDDQFKDKEIAELEYYLTRFQIEREGKIVFNCKKRKAA